MAVGFLWMLRLKRKCGRQASASSSASSPQSKVASAASRIQLPSTPLPEPPIPSPLEQNIENSSKLSQPPSQALKLQKSPKRDIDTMSPEVLLRKTLQTLSSNPTSPQAPQLLREAKKHLMNLKALIPQPSTAPDALTLGRATLEAGALLSIRAQDPDSFTRYYQQLQPFYELPAERYLTPAQAEAGDASQRSKVTGLYLMLLLTKGDYAAFHTLLEGLEMESEEELAKDKFISYPVMLEQWLMEGAYDRVWGATKGEGVPSEEFRVFSEVLIVTIRNEIASCSEKAYPSIPISNAKNLFFLDSEGSVVAFAQERGWNAQDGRLYFSQGGDSVRTEKEILVASGQVIENTIGYARELETIV